MNNSRELTEIEDALTDLFKSVIKEKKLIQSGRLYNSIKFRVVKVGKDYSFRMESLDYFNYLDAEYGITKAALSSREFVVIKQKIAELVAMELIQEITNDTKINKTLG